MAKTTATRTRAPRRVRDNGNRQEEPKSAYWLKQRDRILSVAGRLFLHNGYQGTSVDDVAAAAKVNKASIYYYYENKADLLSDIAMGTIQSLTDQALPVANSSKPPLEKLVEMTANHLRWQMANRGLAGLGTVERAHLPAKMLRNYIKMRDAYEAIFCKVIDDAKAAGDMKAVDSKLAAMFTLGMINSIMQWYKPNGRLSVEDIASQVVDYMLYGLANPAKRARPTASIFQTK